MQEVANNIFVATHFRGPTVAAILTSEGYILIDAPPFRDDARHWKSFLEIKGDDAPIRAMILTDYNPERLVGAHWMKPATLIAHRVTYEYIKNLPSTYVSTISNMLTHSSYEQAEFNTARIILPMVVFDQTMSLRFGKNALEVMYRPGPTLGSIMVHCTAERLLFSGDQIVVGTAPYLNSISCQSWMQTLAEIESPEFPADLIIPGHGNVTVKTAIKPIQLFLEMARERLRFLYDSDQSLSETSRLIHELLNFFPPPLESELADVQHRVRTLLQYIYAEYRQADIQQADLSSSEDDDDTLLN
jgi:glyoxylase-like metal-dependent hydrolase (beta-lactamase superfamily II)